MKISCLIQIVADDGSGHCTSVKRYDGQTLVAFLVHVDKALRALIEHVNKHS